MTSAEAADAVAITAEAINKEESDFIRKLLKGDRETKGCKRGLLLKATCTTFVMVLTIACV